MRALTLHRPWPWAIFHAPQERRKRLENREWPPWPSIVGQVIAIHAGKKWDEDGAAMILEETGFAAVEANDSDRWHAEGIIGTARVIGWIEGEDPDHLKTVGLVPPGLIQQQLRWHFGPFAWVLDEDKALPAPIPCRGMQGMWTVPAEIEEQIRRAA